MSELAAAQIVAVGGSQTEDDVALQRARLERGPFSLIEELHERPFSNRGNLLILVDQFEELFRYRGLAAREEAEAFVALLLASANQRDVPIYVVLTMRAASLGSTVPPNTWAGRSTAERISSRDRRGHRYCASLTASARPSNSAQRPRKSDRMVITT